MKDKYLRAVIVIFIGLIVYCGYLAGVQDGRQAFKAELREKVMELRENLKNDLRNKRR